MRIARATLKSSGSLTSHVILLPGPLEPHRVIRSVLMSVGQRSGGAEREKERAEERHRKAPKK